jgi:hypothetical protein
VLFHPDTLPATPSRSSALLSLVLQKPLRSFSRMLTSKGTKIIPVIYLSCMILCTRNLLARKRMNIVQLFSI